MSRLLNLDPGSVLLVYKPEGWTSFDAVNKIKRLIIRYMHRTETDPLLKKRKVKVGHAGTLDPLATGLLVVCVGKETKNIDRYMGQLKTYTGTLYLGATTPSFDRETEPVIVSSPMQLTDEQITQAAQQLTGVLQQIPPAYSAVQQGGVRAYQLARSGQTVELKSREVEVTRFQITRIALPYIDFEIDCSKGTYIRSLARDIGDILGCGAYLYTLCRTRIGNFHLEDAITLDELAEEFNEPLQLKRRD